MNQQKIIEAGRKIYLADHSENRTSERSENFVAMKLQQHFTAVARREHKRKVEKIRRFFEKYPQYLEEK